MAAAPVAAPAAAGDLAAINADLDDAGAAANNAIDNVAPAPGDGPDAEDAPRRTARKKRPPRKKSTRKTTNVRLLPKAWMMKTHPARPLPWIKPD